MKQGETFAALRGRHVTSPRRTKGYLDYAIARVGLDAMEKPKLKWPNQREDLSRLKIVGAMLAARKD